MHEWNTGYSFTSFCQNEILIYVYCETPISHFLPELEIPTSGTKILIYVYNQNGITIYNAAGLSIEKAWCITQLYIEKR